MSVKWVFWNLIIAYVSARLVDETEIRLRRQFMFCRLEICEKMTENEIRQKCYNCCAYMYNDYQKYFNQKLNKKPKYKWTKILNEIEQKTWKENMDLNFLKCKTPG